MIKNDIVRYSDYGVIPNYGIGDRRVIQCNDKSRECITEVLYAELLGNCYENKVNKITFINPMGQAIQFNYIIKNLKESNPKLNICVYSDETIDEIYSENDMYKMNILKNIDTLIDGKYNSDLKSNLIWYRKSTNQRVIDMKATNYFNDGYLYLTGQVHLQEPFNNRYQFSTWLKAVNERFEFDGRLKAPADWRGKECIQYICRFDPDMKITNNIKEMEEYMISMGTGKKMTCKFRYLFNRWCHRVILKQVIKNDNCDWLALERMYMNPPILNLSNNLPHYDTANELLDFYKEYRKWEISIEKKRFNVEKPIVIHNYRKEEVMNRHKLANKKAREERDIKKANKKVRSIPKKEPELKGLDKRMYKSSKACKIINKFKKNEKKKDILKLLEA